MPTLPKVLINRADYQIGGGAALRLRTQELLFHWVLGEAVTRTAILAYVIAILGLAMIVAGAWGLFILFIAEIPRVL
jgi:hypothetical protein